MFWFQFVFKAYICIFFCICPILIAIIELWYNPADKMSIFKNKSYFKFCQKQSYKKTLLQLHILFIHKAVLADFSETSHSIKNNKKSQEMDIMSSAHLKCSLGIKTFSKLHFIKEHFPNLTIIFSNSWHKTNQMQSSTSDSSIKVISLCSFFFCVLFLLTEN